MKTNKQPLSRFFEYFTKKTGIDLESEYVRFRLQHIPKHKQNIEKKLIVVVCNVFNVTEQQLVSSSRHREFVNARGCYYKMSRDMGNHYAYIGKLIGNRDHATVINGVRRFEDHILWEPDLNDKYKLVKELMNQ